MTRSLIIALILLTGAALRLPTHNWDQDQHLHTDERYVTRVTIDRVQLPPNITLPALVDPHTSPIDPRAGGLLFTYGALPIYLTKAVTLLAGGITGNPDYASYSGVQQTGRVVAGLFDTVTTLLVLLLGWRLAGFRPGAVAGALYALAVLPIQVSHFYIVEPFLTTFLTATALATLIYLQTGRPAALAAAGLLAGLSAACKISGLVALAIPLAGVILAPRQAAGQPWARRVLRDGTGVIALTGLGLFLGDPFALFDAPTYWRQVSEQVAIQQGTVDVTFTRQYVGTWPVIYPLGQLLLLGAGPVAGLVAAWRVADPAGWRRLDRSRLLLVAGGGVYFASIAFLDAKWLRYTLPLVPYLCLLAATARGVSPGLLSAGRGGAGTWLGGSVLLLGSALTALAFTAIYSTAPTRVTASEWIYAQVAPGARLGTETGDDPMPRRLPGHDAPAAEYTIQDFDMLADRPPVETAGALRTWLAGIDYLVLASTRAEHAVSHLPWRYPVQIRYYTLLEQGDLGFALAASATDFPALAALRIPDSQPWLDETFYEYDHPVVRVYRRVHELAPGEWEAFFAGAVTTRWAPTRSAP